MARIPTPRAMVMVKEEPVVHQFITRLIERLGEDGDLSYAGRGLAQIGWEKYDSVVLDLRRIGLNSEGLQHVPYIQPSLVGHALIITGELPESKLNLIEKCLATVAHKKPSRRYLPSASGKLPTLAPPPPTTRSADPRP